jgi:hypothetical protein
LIVPLLWGRGEGGGGSIKSKFNVEVVNERKLVEMICMQPPLDVGGFMKNCHCRCLCCKLLEGGEGWPHALLAVIGTDGNENCYGNCLSKKGVGQGKRRGGIKRWVCFFMLSSFVIVFWLTFFNAGQLISYQDQVNCWTGFFCKIFLPVVQIWSSNSVKQL